MKFGSLFAGIGGFDLGLERAGMKCAWQVDNNEYCLKVLAKHWPEVKRYGDIRTVGRHNLESVDLICGGFPCQPYSVAGKRRGEADDRNLWPEFLRIVRELRPTWVVGENVPGIISMYLDTVLFDLEGEAYTCWTFNIPACAFDAPHRRERIWIVAYSECNDNLSPDRSGLRETEGISQVGEQKHSTTRELRRAGEIRIPNSEHVAYAEGDLRRTSGDKRPQSFDGSGTGADSSWWTVEPDVGRVAHGVPTRVDRLRALGNAVVPQVAEFIGRRILEVENRE